MSTFNRPLFFKPSKSHRGIMENFRYGVLDLTSDPMAVKWGGAARRVVNSELPVRGPVIVAWNVTVCLSASP